MAGKPAVVLLWFLGVFWHLGCQSKQQGFDPEFEHDSAPRGCEWCVWQLQLQFISYMVNDDVEILFLSTPGESKNRLWLVTAPHMLRIPVWNGLLNYSQFRYVNSIKFDYACIFSFASSYVLILLNIDHKTIVTIISVPNKLYIHLCSQSNRLSVICIMNIDLLVGCSQVIKVNVFNSVQVVMRNTADVLSLHILITNKPERNEDKIQMAFLIISCYLVKPETSTEKWIPVPGQTLFI